MNCLNIQVQFNLSQVHNTSTHVDVNAHLLEQGGQISETNVLSYGKFAVIVKDKVRSKWFIHCAFGLEANLFFLRKCTLARYWQSTSMSQENTDGLLVQPAEQNYRTYLCSFSFINLTTRLLLVSTTLPRLLESLCT